MIDMTWTDAEIYLLHELYPDLPGSDVAEMLGRSVGSVSQMASKIGIKKSDYFYASNEAHRMTTESAKASMKTRFKKGLTPWNKGTKGVMPKPTNGFTHGHMPSTWKPIGAERRDKDGHLIKKVSDTRCKNTDWQPLRHIAWRKDHGDIPAGMFVICKDHNPDNLHHDNLLLVDRAENMRLNSFRTRHPELISLYQIKGAINRQVNRINKQNEQPTH